MLTVTVALVAGGFPRLAPPHDKQTPDLPYRDRLKAEVEADEKDTLHDVFKRAVEQWNVSYVDQWEGMGDLADLVYFISFYKPEDEDGYPVEESEGNVFMSRAQYGGMLTVVGEDGLIRWHVPLKEVRIGDLIRAAEYGLVDGDPLRPYILIQPQAGNGILIVWSAIMGALAIASNIGGALQLYDRIKAKLLPGRKVIEDHFLEWSDRGGDPGSLRGTLDQTPWETDDLAMLLGIEPEEVEALMNLYGFALDSDGKWRPGQDEEARLLRMLDADVIYSFSQLPNPEVEFRNRAQHLLTTGERIPEPTYDDYEGNADDEDDDVPGLDDFEEEFERLPLHLISFDCACGQDACNATVRVTIRADEEPRVVRMNFKDMEDHFEFPVMLFGRLGMQALEEGEEGESEPD